MLPNIAQFNRANYEITGKKITFFAGRQEIKIKGDGGRKHLLAHRIMQAKGQPDIHHRHQHATVANAGRIAHMRLNPKSDLRIATDLATDKNRAAMFSEMCLQMVEPTVKIELSPALQNTHE